MHTLKGIALNLGLTGWPPACGTMTEALRSRDTLPEQTDVLLRAVDREYQKVCDTLARLNPHTEPRKTTDDKKRYQEGLYSQNGSPAPPMRWRNSCAAK